MWAYIVVALASISRSIGQLVRLSIGQSTIASTGYIFLWIFFIFGV